MTPHRDVIALTYLDTASTRHTSSSALAGLCCLYRTGPGALTQAMYDFFKQAGVGMMDFSQSNFTSPEGVKVKDVRVLPQVHLGGGWEVVGKQFGACSDFGQRHPEALVCHMFWGSWKPGWQLQPSHSYGSCASVNRTEQGPTSPSPNSTAGPAKKSALS